MLTAPASTFIFTKFLRTAEFLLANILGVLRVHYLYEWHVFESKLPYCGKITET